MRVLHARRVGEELTIRVEVSAGNVKEFVWDGVSDEQALYETRLLCEALVGKPSEEVLAVEGKELTAEVAPKPVAVAEVVGP